MKPTDQARPHRLSAEASAFKPALEASAAVADTARPSDALLAEAAPRAGALDATMDVAAAGRNNDEADGAGGEELRDGVLGCGGASQADERESISEDGRSARLGSAARRNARRRRMVNRVKSERDGLEDYVAALTSGRPFVPVAVHMLPHAPPHAFMLPELAAAAAQQGLAARAAAAPPHGLAPPGLSRGFTALCASRAVLQLPRVVVSHAHAASRWAAWLPGLGAVRPRPAPGGEGAAAALEHAVRAAVTAAFADPHTDCVLWAVAVDSGTVHWVSDTVTAALGHAPAGLVGYPYIMGTHIEDHAKFVSELRVIIESEGELTCMPRRLFRRRHGFGHEVLVSCAGSIFVRDPETGELMGLVANRIVATLR